MIRLGFVDDGTQSGDDVGAFAGAQATVRYANAYLGGLHGHVIRLVHCSTTSDAGTTGPVCGEQFLAAHVAAVVAAQSFREMSTIAALAGNISYVTLTDPVDNAAASVSGSRAEQAVFVLTNPLGEVTAGLIEARRAKARKAAILVPVYPTEGANLIYLVHSYQRAGITLKYVGLDPTTYSLYPGEIRRAIGHGYTAFTILGSADISAAAARALRTLGFTGPIVAGAPPSPATTGPGAVSGLDTITTMTSDPADADVKLYDAIARKYLRTARRAGTAEGFVAVLAVVRALARNPAAVDAASIMSTLRAMPKPVALPMGGGLTFRCGSRVVHFVPNVCAAGVLAVSVADGGAVTDTPLNTAGILSP